MNNYNIELEFEDLHFEVVGTFSYDKGLHTFPNGDPGYPESHELNIDFIFYENEDVTALLEAFNVSWTKFEEAVLEAVMNDELNSEKW